MSEIRNRATVAARDDVVKNSETSCGAGANWSVKGISAWDPRVLRLGRYLCWAWYRDQAETQRTFPGLGAILEDAIRVYGPWGELLAGAYRGAGEQSVKMMLCGSRQRSGRGVEAAKAQGIGKRGLVKCTTLGLEVWYPEPSLDGRGRVRALEICLYQFVGSKFFSGVLQQGTHLF